VVTGSGEQHEREREIFQGFLTQAPDFKARIAGAWWQPDDDPPDARFKDTEGREVGVELKAWINEEQIAHAKKREALEARFLALFDPQPTNRSKAVTYVWLRPAADVWSRAAKDRVPSSHEAQVFKEELLSLVAEIDAEWMARGREVLQGETVTKFGERLTLGRFLEAVMLFPKAVIDPGNQDRLAFPLRGGAYGEQHMLRPLQDMIFHNREKYATTKAGKGLDRLILLIHYDDRALQYNSPIEAPDWDLTTFAKGAAYMIFALDELSETPSPWDEVFLFDAVRGRAIQVHPQWPATETPRAKL
jgi:hypothetical protein